MSYQQQSQGVHRLNEFVPTYVPHSDFLPNKIVDSNQPELQQWVPPSLFSSPTISSKSVSAMSTPKSLLSSIPADTCLCAPTKTWWSTSPSPRSSSTAESSATDLNHPSIHYQGQQGKGYSGSMGRLG